MLRNARFPKPRRPRNSISALLISVAVSAALLSFTAGCNSNDPDQRARDEKTREDVARATERAKPAIEDAGRKLGEAAHDAADQARAAAQGVRDGWKNGQHALVDINSASEDQLLDLPGINRPAARKIIAHRPYGDKHDLVEKGVVSGPEYQQIRDDITAK
jgi:DNA uptake protein ComE-like DNA-binding protein